MNGLKRLTIQYIEYSWKTPASRLNFSTNSTYLRRETRALGDYVSFFFLNG